MFGRNTVYLVGLTGGMGSGKSTVAARLRELGCEVIDADVIAREVVEPGRPALADLAAHFGPSILTEAGTLDRQRLAELAFADDTSRAVLDRITHPRIAACIAERVAELGSPPGAPPDQLVVVDHPLLVETRQARRFDAVVVVTADEELRVRRLVGLRGLREADVRARFRAQASDEERRAVATHVINNEGGLDDLLGQVERVHTALLEAARRIADTTAT